MFVLIKFYILCTNKQKWWIKNRTIFSKELFFCSLVSGYWPAKPSNSNNNKICYETQWMNYSNKRFFCGPNFYYVTFSGQVITKDTVLYYIISKAIQNEKRHHKQKDNVYMYNGKIKEWFISIYRLLYILYTHKNIHKHTYSK